MTSSVEPHTRWVIRAMDLRVAVRARAIEGEARVGELRRGRMPRLNMAALAQPRRSRLQQLRIDGAVRFMAIQAILSHRRMLPQEGPAAFRVALVAILVGRALDQLLGIGRPMGIVAAGASDLALAEGHVRRALELRPAHLMALEADLHLCRLDEQTVFGQGFRKSAGHGRRRFRRVHDLMTRHTGEAA